MDREQLRKDAQVFIAGMKEEAGSIGRITVAVWIAVFVMMAIFNVIECMGW
ncbi:MAG: hypothetical protein M0Z70_05175 [Nitrospiraceae bacterium]|nr:hypothetical protein [Nitrospiraceae bacterium]